MDGDENRAAEHELARARVEDPQARRICRKNFSSKDRMIKVGVMYTHSSTGNRVELCGC